MRLTTAAAINHGALRELLPPGQRPAQPVPANTISPGLIHTPATGPLLADPPEVFQRMVLDRIPMGRVGQPEDIAKAALFLASDDSEWISGANIVVDGGLTTLG
jgi:NAD(P)-dependent dehydrogenase (short-subunit alcohol dehydrogenase family)